MASASASGAPAAPPTVDTSPMRLAAAGVREKATGSPRATAPANEKIAAAFAGVVDAIPPAHREGMREPVKLLAAALGDTMGAINGLAAAVDEAQSDASTAKTEAASASAAAAAAKAEAASTKAELKSALELALAGARRHARITLRAAATRILELIVETILEVTRDEMRALKLYSPEQAQKQARLFREGHPSVPAAMTADMAARIVQRAAAMEAAEQSVMGVAGVSAAMKLVKLQGDDEAHPDPAAEEEDWAALGKYADMLFGGKQVQLENVRAMLREYVKLRESIKEELEPRAPSRDITGLF